MIPLPQRSTNDDDKEGTDFLAGGDTPNLQSSFGTNIDTASSRTNSTPNSIIVPEESGQTLSTISMSYNRSTNDVNVFDSLSQPVTVGDREVPVEVEEEESLYLNPCSSFSCDRIVCLFGFGSTK
jgi:hypothetical protein